MGSTSEILRQVGGELCALARERLAADPDAHPVGVVFDVPSAARRGLITPDQAASRPRDALIVQVVSREQAVALCADLPSAIEWFEPAGTPPRHLIVVVRTVRECSVAQLELGGEAPPAGTEIDPWQRFAEEEQSYSLLEKHRARLTAQARERGAASAAGDLVGLVCAPEVAARMLAHDQQGQPLALPSEATGEFVALLEWDAAVGLVGAIAPQQVEWLEAQRGIEGRLSIVALTEHGVRGLSCPLADP